MNTRKPISTVSFNSRPFLLNKLNELTNAGILEFWACVFHQAEPDEINDESGHKDHAHVYMKPAKQIQTVDLRNEFKEPDPTNKEGKPLGCLVVVSSKFDDWYLYALHNPYYLASKGQSRVYEYKPEDVLSSNEDDLNYFVTQIDYNAINPYMTIAQYTENGKSFTDMMLNENIPIRDLRNWQNAFELVASRRVERNGRLGHVNNYSEEVDDDVMMKSRYELEVEK